MQHARWLALSLITAAACASAAPAAPPPARPRAPAAAPAPWARADEMPMRDIERPQTKDDVELGVLRPVTVSEPLTKQSPKKRSR